MGLAMAAAGFITGSIGGVVLINLAVRRGWIASDDAEKLRKRTLFSGFLPKGQTREGSRLTSEGESIDTLSYHVALIMVAYLVSWLMLSAIELLLNLLGPFGAEIASTLWGVNFIFSMFAASLLRLVIRRTGIDYTIDNGTLNRINGLSVDLTVTACLAGISLTALAAYYVPVIILILVGIVITCLILPWYSSRIYSDHAFFRMLVLFGTATGTLPTGLSLLRVVDPDFETPAAQDYAYASGLVFVFVFPLILFVNLPAYSYSQNNPVLFYAMLAGVLVDRLAPCPYTILRLWDQGCRPEHLNCRPSTPLGTLATGFCLSAWRDSQLPHIISIFLLTLKFLLLDPLFRC